MSLSLLLCQRASQTGSFLYSSVQFTIWGNRSPGKQAAKLHPMRQQISSKRFSTMELRPCFSMLAILNGADHQSLRSRLCLFANEQYDWHQKRKSNYKRRCLYIQSSTSILSTLFLYTEF